MNIGITMLSQAVAFAIFIWFTVKFVWPPLMKAIEHVTSSGVHTPDLGGKATTQQVTDAVCAFLAEHPVLASQAA